MLSDMHLLLPATGLFISVNLARPGSSLFLWVEVACPLSSGHSKD